MFPSKLILFPTTLLTNTAVPSPLSIPCPANTPAVLVTGITLDPFATSDDVWSVCIGPPVPSVDVT